MENDRLYIRCKGCGERIMVTKSFGRPLDMKNADKVIKFLIEHSYDRLCNYNVSDTESQFEFIMNEYKI